MDSDLLTFPVIRHLLSVSLPQRRSLLELFGRIPATRCRRQASCCSLLPEMSLAEGLTVLERLGQLAAPRHIRQMKGMHVPRYQFSHLHSLLVAPPQPLFDGK